MAADGSADYRDGRGLPRRMIVIAGSIILDIMNQDEAIIFEIAGNADYRDGRGWPRRIFIAGGIILQL